MLPYIDKVERMCVFIFIILVLNKLCFHWPSRYFKVAFTRLYLVSILLKFFGPTIFRPAQ